MQVLLTSEAKFERLPDGTIWGAAAYSHAVWGRYLDVFSSVLVVARVGDVREPSPGLTRASGPGISFGALPSYSGLRGLVRSRKAVRAAVTQALGLCPAVIVRSPSPTAYFAAQAMLRGGRPYAAQIVGDPDQVFSAGAFRHPLRVPLRHAATAAQKLVARQAHAVMYVTSRTLQRKYPATGLAFSGSDVSLDDSAFAAPSATARPNPDPFTLVTVASLDQPYKGTEVLLEAFTSIRQSCRQVRLLIVGGGALLPAYQARARALGVADDVEFLGQVDREGVRRALDRAELFVLPSLTEGLPRALLEAMARRLPCVATHVGGIPELLPERCLVPPKDAPALARRLADFIADERARDLDAERNQAVARGFHECVQRSLCKEFLSAVRDVSARRHREAICA
jgi:glycosyltransferase involved in cell wall biosynthesis